VVTWNCELFLSEYEFVKKGIRVVWVICESSRYRWLKGNLWCFFKYTNSWDELEEVTCDFLENGDLLSHYNEIYGDEKGDKVVDDE